MSQDIRTNPKISEPSSDAIALQSWSADTYADKLMDELFSDIDRMLEGSTKLPTEVQQPEYVSLQPLKIPAMPQAEAAIAQPEQVTQEAGNTANGLQTPVEPKKATQKAKGAYWGSNFGSWFDKLLLAIALTSLAGMFLLWLASQHRLNWRLRPQPVASPVAKPQISESDSQFIKYMLRSLEAIDRNAQASKQLAAAAGVQQASNLPQVFIPSNLPPVPNPTTRIIEKVYIPVYPPSASSTAPASTPGKTPAANPSGLRAASAPAKPVPQSIVPLPPSSPLISAAPDTQLPAPQQTLVGVVQQGRPAGLFVINGVTQRIHQGESIGNSGWTLVTIAKQEAIVRRNGEVRSVYVGQKF
ncbi:MAG TPA: hypothetical protein V6D12_06785 [Candidatus Obscuribacterales bacterium]